MSLVRHFLPVDVFRFATPFVPAKKFDFSQSVQVSNRLTYALRADGRDIAFKVLRSSNRGRGHAGALPPLLLLHGMGLHIASFRGLAEYLIDSMDLILPDYNGFAHDQGWPAGGIPVPSMARIAVRLVEALGLPSVNIGGSSLGGGISLLAATMKPLLFNRIVVLNPAIFPQPLPRFYRLVDFPIIGELVMGMTPADQMVRGVVNIGYASPATADPELLQIYGDTMASRSNRMKLMDTIRHLPRRDADVGRYLAQVSKFAQPTLVIWGELDRLLAADAGRRLAELLPNRRYAGLPELSHLPHEESPQRVARLVLDFLR